MPEYLLPDVGEGLTEAEIVTWKVKVGDVVAVNDIVVEIETAKSLVELPSPYAGDRDRAAGRRRARPCRSAPRSSRSASRRAPAAARPADAEPEMRSTCPTRPPAAAARASPWSAGRRPSGAPRAGRAASRSRGRGRVHRTRRRPRHVQPERHPAARAVSQIVSAVVTDAERQGAAVGAPEAPSTAVPDLRPAPTRRRAGAGQAAGPQAGQGPRRRPDHARPRPDPRARSPARTSSRPPARPPEARRRSASRRCGRSATGEREYREPIKGVRKMMAGAMVQSAFTAPHVTEWVTVDATGTMEFVERLKKRREFKDVKVSPLLVLARAVDAGDAAYAGDQLVLGRGGPGGRLQELRQPRHRGGHPARPRRTQRQGRAGPLAPRAGAARSTSSPPRLATGRRSRRR